MWFKWNCAQLVLGITSFRPCGKIKSSFIKGESREKREGFNNLRTNSDERRSYQGQTKKIKNNQIYPYRNSRKCLYCKNFHFAFFILFLLKMLTIFVKWIHFNDIHMSNLLVASMYKYVFLCHIHSYYKFDIIWQTPLTPQPNCSVTRQSHQWPA